MSDILARASASRPSGESVLTRPFPFGIDVDTREKVNLSLAHFLTGYWSHGQIGIGKSNHVLAPIYASLPCPVPGAVFDGAGTLTTNTFHAVACFATRRMAYADVFPEFRTQAANFVLKHPMIVFGDGQRNISIDVLARQRLPSGELETMEQVNLRTFQIFNRMFADDADKRVRFRRVSMAVMAILIAARRPIREYKLLLAPRPSRRDEPDPAAVFLAFCFREAERLGVPPCDRQFIADQVRIFHDLRRLSPQQFRAETESTDNALNFFATSPGADYVNDQTINLPWLLDHGGKILLSHTLGDLGLATVLFRAYDSIIRTWVRGREPLRRPTSFGYQVIDEPFWIDAGVSDEWAIQRNKRWSVLLLHQRESQLDRVSPDLSDLMLSLAKLHGRFRPDKIVEAMELAYAVREFRPDGLQIPYTTSSTSETKTFSEALGDSWSKTLSESRSFGQSSSTGGSEDWGSGSSDGTRLSAETYAPTSFDSGQSSRQGGGSSWQDGTSDQESHGTADSTGGSKTHTTGGSTSVTWNNLVHRIPIEEQARAFAQELLRTPDYTIFLSYRGKTRRVRLFPQREYPRTLFGVDVAQQAREFQQLVYGARRRERPTFDTGVRVELGGSTPAATSAPVPAPPEGEPAAGAPAPTGSPSAPPPATPPSSTEPEAPRTTPQPKDTAPSLTVDGPGDSRLRLGARDSAILSAAADWRFVTLDHLRLDPDTFGGYSGITDRVKVLSEGGLLSKMQPPAPRGTGSNPARYSLTRSGAKALAALTGREEARLIQVAENAARIVAQVGRLELGQLPHTLAVADVLASASAAIRSLPDVSIAATRFDKEVVLRVPVDAIAHHLTPSIRRRLSMDDADTCATLRPDAVIVLSVPTSTGGRTHVPLLVEVETGRKETSFEELGEALALRAYAAVRSGVITEAVTRLGFSPLSEARILSIAASAPLETRLASGASRASGAVGASVDAILRLSSLDRTCPKAPPVSRASRATAIASIAGSFVSAIWRTPLDTTRSSLLG